LGLHTGDEVRLLINDSMRTFQVAGELKRRPGAIGEQKIIVADIALAQIITRKIGKLDSIEVEFPAGTRADHWQEVLRKVLPAAIAIDPAGSRTSANRKMLTAFRSNLHVLSYIALIVGAFLIYNTISVSVVRRRNEIGVVRALGATRLAVASAFLVEAGGLAVAGTLVGIGLGRLMAAGAVALVGTTVQSLYVSSTPAPVALTGSSILAAFFFGLSAALFAALAPAVEASRVAPVVAMARGREQYVARKRSRRSMLWSCALLTLAGAASRLPVIDGQPLFAYVSALLLIGGMALGMPTVVVVFGRFMRSGIGKLFGVEALLAMRSLEASIARSSVLTAALAISISMVASIGIMVGSFRETVRVWMNNELRADFYLRPAVAAAADRHPTMSADIADGIARLPGVAAVDRFRAYPTSYEGLPATFAGGETNTVVRGEAIRFLPGEDRGAILRKLPRGDYAIVSEPFANKHHVRVGDVVRVPLGNAEPQFSVLGIYYDYSTERGFIIVDRRTLLKYLPNRDASNLAVYLKPGADPSTVKSEIDGVISGRAVELFSNRSLREGAIQVFDRTFRITYALEAVACVVAIAGIAGAFLAMVIDRRREFGLLRFLGGAKTQVRRIILAEAGVVGLLATVVGLVVGVLLSLILIFVINKQAFGWTIQVHWPVGALLLALISIYVVTIGAAVYPARIAVAMNPVEVMHDE
jgi:putative ABC transport system permease protein